MELEGQLMMELLLTVWILDALVRVCLVGGKGCKFLYWEVCFVRGGTVSNAKFFGNFGELNTALVINRVQSGKC